MKAYLKTLLWALAGLFVSFYYIKNQILKYFAYPLIALSLLMFLLAYKQYKKQKKN